MISGRRFYSFFGYSKV